MEHIKFVEKTSLNTTDYRVATGNPKVAVVGIGNLLLKDEGVGIHVIQHLTVLGNSANVEIIDGGTSSDIVPLINDNVEHLVIIDAAIAGGEPGTIYRFNIDDLNTGMTTPFSLHEKSLVESLKMLPLLGKQLKSVTIFGIEPGEIDFGLELSAEVAEKIPRIIELVLEETDKVNKSMEVKK